DSRGTIVDGDKLLASRGAPITPRFRLLPLKAVMKDTPGWSPCAPNIVTRHADDNFLTRYRRLNRLLLRCSRMRSVCVRSSGRTSGPWHCRPPPDGAVTVTLSEWCFLVKG